MKGPDGDDKLAPEAGEGPNGQPDGPTGEEGARAKGSWPAPSNSAVVPAMAPGVHPARAGGPPTGMAAPLRVPRGAAPNKRMPRDPLTRVRICWEYVKGVCARPPGTCRYAHVIMPQRPPGATPTFAPIASAGVGPRGPSLPASLYHQQQQQALSRYEG